MTFEQLVDRLTSQFDVTQPRAVDVANERLAQMVSKAKSLRAAVSVGITTADCARYPLPANVAHVYKLVLTEDDTFPDDNVLPPDDSLPGTNAGVYEGEVSIEDLWNVSVGMASIGPDQNVFAIEPNADEDMNTEAIRLYPAPSTTGMGIIGLVALRPNTLTYSSATGIPIPIDQHGALLDGARAELFDDEGRQDEALKMEASFMQGTEALERAVNSRGTGSGGHRMRVRGYDLAR